MRPAWEARPVEEAKTAAPGLPARDEIAAYHLMEEGRLVGGLVERAIFTATEHSRIADLAAKLVRAARSSRHKFGGIDAFMHEYGLTSEEGVILMCLAEALLRIPDKDTADALIAEKIGGGRWEKHLGASDSLFVNASTFGLMITGRVVKLGDSKGAGPGAGASAAALARVAPLRNLRRSGSGNGRRFDIIILRGAHSHPVDGLKSRSSAISRPGGAGSRRATATIEPSALRGMCAAGRT